jgi:hypothetical protein
VCVSIPAGWITCRHCLHGVPRIAFCYTHHVFCSENMTDRLHAISAKSVHIPRAVREFLASPYGQSPRGPHTYVHGTGVLVTLVAVVVCHGLHGVQCGQWWPVSRWSPPPLPSLHLHGLHGLHLCQWFHWWHWWPVSTASMVAAVVVSSVSVVASFTASVVVS